MKHVMTQVSTLEGVKFPVIASNYKELEKEAENLCKLRGWHLDKVALAFEIACAKAKGKMHRLTERVYMDELFVPHGFQRETYH